MNGPGRWNDRIRAKLAPRSVAGEARAYLERWRVAKLRLDLTARGAKARPEMEAEVEDLRRRYLREVRTDLMPTPNDARGTPGLDRADGPA